MKTYFFIVILLALATPGFSQVTRDSSKRVQLVNRQISPNLKVIAAAKAAMIRKNVVDLKLQLQKASDSVALAKKDIDAVVDKMKADLDAMSEMGETESLRLQMAMDRLGKMISTLSNILKKISDTQQSITQNMK